MNIASVSILAATATGATVITLFNQANPILHRAFWACLLRTAPVGDTLKLLGARAQIASTRCMSSGLCSAASIPSRRWTSAGLAWAAIRGGSSAG